jgi:ATP-dependent protease ClpP protease subunit
MNIMNETLQIPSLKRTIRLIGELMPTEQLDLGLQIQNELIDYREQLSIFDDILLEMETSMRAEGCLSEEYIQSSIDEMLMENAPELEIIINSGGGSASDGMAIIDLILELKRDYGVKITTYAIGNCASMATGIYMVGDRRLAGDNAIFMLHQISGGASGTHNQVESIVQYMKIVAKQYKKLFDDTNIPEDQLNQMLTSDRDYYFDVDQAREWGIVNDYKLFEDLEVEVDE